MKLWEHYHTPQTLDDALRILHDYGGRARVIAGGTDLLVDMRAENHAPHEALVDITGIAAMNGIRQDGEHIYIGAGATHTSIVKSPLLQAQAACLVESCGVVGGPQVRNVATIGGNVAHALPAGDGTVSLVALDAQAEVVMGGERRWLPIADLYLGPGQSLLDPTRDLLVQLRFAALGAHEATSFSRIMRPQGVALPVLGCAVWIQLDDSGATVADARICIAPIAPTPMRARDIEADLIGKPANDDTIDAIAQRGMTALHPRTSKYRASADYRREMIAVLLKRTLGSAFGRILTSPPVPLSTS
jgi:CO/xanthine dehydrogenase FAD-binding subunit